MAIFCDLGGSNLALVGRAHRCIASADARPADDDGYVRDLFGLMGTTVIPERSVADRNRITSGGVTAGIDLGLSIAAHLRGEERVQLLLEYDPKPPFDAGSPDRAGDALVRDVLVRRSALIEAARVQAVEASKLALASCLMPRCGAESGHVRGQPRAWHPILDDGCREGQV